jgi:mono/diheme cytochrome c family protein
MEVKAGKVDFPKIEPTPVPRSWPRGQALLTKKRCLACHQFRDKDGRVSPDQSFLGDMRSIDYIGRFLNNPRRVIPGAIMPRIVMTSEEKGTIIEFLSTQAIGPVFRNNSLSDDHLHHEKFGPSGYVLRSKQLYMRLCQRCHGAAGDGFGIIQPNLANFPRPFAGNAEFFERISDERVVTTVEQGVPGSSMPPYGRLLSQSTRNNLIDLLFEAFVGIDRSDKAPLSPLPAPGLFVVSHKRAARIFEKFCARCHGITGTGKGAEYLKYLPHPRNLTNQPYVSAISDERIARTIYDGSPGTAMPSFRERMSSDELWALVKRVRVMSEGRHLWKTNQ